AATPVRTAGPPAVDPLEDLGQQISQRDFTRIAQLHVGASEDAQVKQASARKLETEDQIERRRNRDVNTLPFACQVQAAGINRRIKQDMIDQAPRLKPESLRALCFFEAEVSDEAFLAFESYVNLKWPLRVYAIEPVIAQQNVADAFGRSRRTAFDLVG